MTLSSRSWMRAVASQWPSSSIHSFGFPSAGRCSKGCMWKRTRMAIASTCWKLSVCRESLIAKELTPIKWDVCYQKEKYSVFPRAAWFEYRGCVRGRDGQSVPQRIWYPHLCGCVRHPWLPAPFWTPAVSDRVPPLSFPSLSPHI